MLSTDQKGAIAELAIAHAAVKLGIGVSRPVSEGERYDLIFDLRPTLVRVQCKWAALQGDVIAVRCYSSRRQASGFHKSAYELDEVDAIAAYCPDLEQCYLLSLGRFGCRSTIQLRLAPPRNSQKVGILWAKEFEFAGTLQALAGP